MKAKKPASSKKNVYVKKENQELNKLAKSLRIWLKKLLPATKQTVNSWGIPTFELGQPFCFYMVGKNHLTFGFHHGTSLKDPDKLLEGTGKNMRHVKLKSLLDLKSPGLKRLVLQASQLKGQIPLRGMGGKKRASHA